MSRLTYYPASQLMRLCLLSLWAQLVIPAVSLEWNRRLWLISLFFSMKIDWERLKFKPDYEAPTSFNVPGKAAPRL
jgi:hypothetical protein